MSFLRRKAREDTWGERRLVRRACRGDVEAFGSLYDLYVDRVYGYCKARVGSVHDAEDLTETVFLRAYEGIGTYTDRGLPFGAWLFRIAHNVVVDAARKRARRPDEPCELPERTDEAPGPEERAMGAIGEERVRACLSQLTEEQAAVITMRFLWDFDIAATARVLGKTEGAVKAMQHRALRSLARLLAESADESDGRVQADAI